MKEIRANIQPHVLQRVLAALHALPSFPGITVTRVQGQGHGRGKGGQFVPEMEDIFLHDRSQITIVCSNEIADELMRAIQTAAHTGNRGDGLLVVSDLERVVHLRTGEEQAGSP